MFSFFKDNNFIKPDSLPSQGMGWGYLFAKGVTILLSINSQKRFANEIP
ncbi:MAG: hypothetical protein WBB26_14220 [Saprospiraceae bacterium]